MISTLAHRALERDGLGPIRDKVLVGRAAHRRRRAPPLRDGGPRRGGRAREPRARGAPRRPHLLQPQRPPEPDQRLRRDLQVLLVRPQGRPGRVRGLHDEPRRGGREGALAPLARDHRGAHRLRPPPGPPLGVLPGAPAPDPAGLARARHQGASPRSRSTSSRRSSGRATRRCSASCTTPASTRCPAAAPRSSRARVRRKICDDKATAEQWLEIHRTAHRLGLKTNATMLYGHIERLDERVDHMRAPARAAGRDPRLPGLHPARLPPRAQHDRQGLPQADRLRRAPHPRRGAALPRQLRPREGVLGVARRAARPDVARVRRGRRGRHRARGAHLPHGRLDGPAGALRANAARPHPRAGPGAGRARQPVPRPQDPRRRAGERARGHRPGGPAAGPPDPPLAPVQPHPAGPPLAAPSRRV